MVTVIFSDIERDYAGPLRAPTPPPRELRFEGIEASTYSIAVMMAMNRYGFTYSHWGIVDCKEEAMDPQTEERFILHRTRENPDGVWAPVPRPGKEWLLSQVSLEHEGRTLLGDVRGLSRDSETGKMLLIVHHFNGEPWPVSPPADAVVDLREGG